MSDAALATLASVAYDSWRWCVVCTVTVMLVIRRCSNDWWVMGMGSHDIPPFLFWKQPSHREEIRICEKGHRREGMMVERMAIRTPEQDGRGQRWEILKNLAVLTLNSMPYECWDVPRLIGIQPFFFLKKRGKKSRRKAWNDRSWMRRCAVISEGITTFLEFKEKRKEKVLECVIV